MMQIILQKGGQKKKVEDEWREEKQMLCTKREVSSYLGTVKQE